VRKEESNFRQKEQHMALMGRGEEKRRIVNSIEMRYICADRGYNSMH
jgi:hypothetical protein